MILDDITRVEDLIEQYNNYAEMEGLHKNYSEFLESMENVQKPLGDFLAMASVLNGYNEEEFNLPNLRSVINGLNRILADLNKQNTGLDIRYIQDMEESITQQHKLSRQFWMVYVQKMSKDIIGVLDIMEPLLKDRGNNKAGSIKQNLKNIGVKPYINKDDIKNFEGYLKEAKLMIDSLEVNENIKAFLQKIGDGGNASLADLSEEILKWLTRNNFTSKIRLSFESTGGK